MSGLAKLVRLGAGSLTAFYLSGFVFTLIGNPIQQFVNVLDLLRSAAMTAWVVWAVIWGTAAILDRLRKMQLAELARDLDIGGDSPPQRRSA